MSRRLCPILLLLLAACAEGDAGGAESADASATTPEGTDVGPSTPTDAGALPDAALANDPTTPLDAIPEHCRGFDVRGSRYSPGGDVLPNVCAPFHRTRNNPYAVRCIDADPAFQTDWPGDEWCILPPSPEDGLQIRLGPKKHDAPESSFVAAAHAEIDRNHYAKASTSELRHFIRYNIRARPGTHHVFLNALSYEHEDGWSHEGDVGDPGWHVLAAAQRLDQDLPHSTLQIPPENVGIGDSIEAGQQLALSLHHFNATDAPALRELWINFWYAPAEEVDHPIEGIGIFVDPEDLNIPGGAHRLLHYRCIAEDATRIVTLLGHRHASTDRFGAWIERASGDRVSVYESFDYTDPPTYQYDSITTNPVPDVDARRDGAYSGVLDLAAGDALHFVCDVTNRMETPLRFANETLTGEMCVLLGTRTGAALCDRGERVE